MRHQLGRWIANRLKVLLENTQPRIILDGRGEHPYLSRYYLFGGPHMKDGSSPFDVYGNPYPNAIWPEGWGLYIHRFHQSDIDQELHNHPWNWALSFVIAGGYIEERRNEFDQVTQRGVKPLSFNFIRSTDFHRVDLVEDDCWTLFLTGPKARSWGFWDRTTKVYTPWREFLARVQRSARPWS
jgi:hypothetical protein